MNLMLHREIQFSICLTPTEAYILKPIRKHDHAGIGSAPSDPALDKWLRKLVN